MTGRAVLFRRAWALGLCACLATAAGCGREVSEVVYVDTWVKALLRAFEKPERPEGKGPGEPSARGQPRVAEELRAIYTSLGYDGADWQRAEARWFGEKTSAEISSRILQFIRIRKDLNRSRYIRYRSVGLARAEARGTGPGKELGDMGTRRGFSREAWRALEEIWTGDPDTDRQVEADLAALRKALAVVSRPTYLDLMVRSERAAIRKGTHADEERKELCREAGISWEVFLAVDGIWRDDLPTEFAVRSRVWGAALAEGVRSPSGFLP
jgi:hypothetical protein